MLDSHNNSLQPTMDDVEMISVVKPYRCPITMKDLNNENAFQLSCGHYYHISLFVEYQNKTNLKCGVSGCWFVGDNHVNKYINQNNIQIYEPPTSSEVIVVEDIDEPSSLNTTQEEPKLKLPTFITLPKVGGLDCLQQSNSYQLFIEMINKFKKIPESTIVKMMGKKTKKNIAKTILLLAFGHFGIQKMHHSSISLISSSVHALNSTTSNKNFYGTVYTSPHFYVRDGFVQLKHPLINLID